jgi:tellurium resistance protein TerD
VDIAGSSEVNQRGVVPGGIRTSVGEGLRVSSPVKGIGRVEIQLRWDPSPLGAPDSDLDIIAGTYPLGALYGAPDYLVYFGSRSPDGTINLNRDSRNGKGLGADEVMTLEFDRMGAGYGRVVVGVAIQQRPGPMVFGQVRKPGFRILEGYTVLAEGDFATVAGATAATLAEFVRDESGAWSLHELVRGFDAADPSDFAREMGHRPS